MPTQLMEFINSILRIKTVINKKNIIIVGLILLLITIILIVLNISKKSTFSLLSTTPAQNSVNIPIDRPIVFIFSQELSQDNNNNTISIEPMVSTQNTINKNEVIISPDYALSPKTKYTIKIGNILSSKNQKMDDISLTFTTDVDNSPKAKFIRSLPYNNSNFSITYTRSNQMFVITIISKDTQQAKADALSYIRSQGVNPDTIRIDIVEPRYLRSGPGAPPG